MQIQLVKANSYTYNFFLDYFSKEEIIDHKNILYWYN